MMKEDPASKRYDRKTMNYYRIRPEVAGEIADRTIMDVSVHPPIVSHLHYEFEDWFGDCIVTSFPCYLVTKEAQAAILKAGLTGAQFGDAEVTKSENFDILYDGDPLPEFVRLLPVGKPGVDDFGTGEKADLIISQKARDLLESIALTCAKFIPFNGLYAARFNFRNWRKRP